MHVTTAERILAGIVAAYFAYRLWSGWGDGIIYGDGDMDVHADQHPTAFVLTALTTIAVIAICACLALGSDAVKLAAIVEWLWRL
jgi:hypothetical protein